MSKKTQPKPGSEADSSGDPYIDARGAWMERYGTYVQQAYNWRLVALLEAVTLVIAVVGIVYLASQTKFIPYVVKVDKLGSAVAVARADRATPADPRVIEAELGRLIVNARMVATDHVVEVKALHSVYAFMAPNSAASGYLDEWYRGPGHSPLDRAAKEMVQVEIVAILPISDSSKDSSSYQIQWTETIRDLHGKTTATQDWEATVSLAFAAPTDEAAILANPIGLYVTTLNWTQKIEPHK